MSSSSGSGGQEASEELIKIINPRDFDVYEDYVDAYICADDIKFLQVQSMTCWNQIFKSSLIGFRGFQITFTSWSGWVIHCLRYLWQKSEFDCKMCFQSANEPVWCFRLQIHRGNAIQRRFSTKSNVRNSIWYILSAPTGVLN